MRKCIVFRKNIAICPCMERRCTTQWRIQDFPDVGRQLSGGAARQHTSFPNSPKNCLKQDCIPVGCIPPACWPYLPACTGRGGWVSLPGGSPCQNGGLPCQGGILARGSALPEGGSALPERGGLPFQGGACLSGGCLLARGDGIPAYTEADPTCGQNSWHILKILPCPKLRLRAVIKEFGSGGCVPRAPLRSPTAL